MPILGERVGKNLGTSYLKSPLAPFAESYKETISNILNESGFDIFTEPSKVLMMGEAYETLRNFFVEESVDPSSLTTEEYDDHIEMMNEQFNNNKEAILEYTPMGQHNPIVGMSFPMHKNLLMNNVFDKVLPRSVAVSPKFTLTMETRYLVTPDGKEIDLFKNQLDITPAIDATVPFKEIELSLPEYGQSDILTEIGGSSLDNLSIETHISAILVDVEVTDAKTGTTTTETKWLPREYRFTPGYGNDYERQLLQTVDLSEFGLENDMLSGTMHKNKFQVSSSRGIIKAVKLKARKDTTNGLTATCYTKWSSKTDLVEIPDATPINTPISPEEVKDIAALYEVNQLTKIMSMIKDVMGTYKDDKIRLNLQDSYSLLPSDQKVQSFFDFKPRVGYAHDSLEWRHKMFFDSLDTQVGDLLSILNDPNMTISIVGRPDLIRKITPTEYSYQSPANVGPIDLEFTKTVMTSDKRVYQFMSSNKLNNSNDLMILLNPRNTGRIIYQVVDYHMYVSNEIRNAQLHTLPSIHAVDRWKFLQYQPVQGRVEILNPSGL